MFEIHKIDTSLHKHSNARLRKYASSLLNIALLNDFVHLRDRSDPKYILLRKGKDIFGIFVVTQQYLCMKFIHISREHVETFSIILRVHLYSLPGLPFVSSFFSELAGYPTVIKCRFVIQFVLSSLWRLAKRFKLAVKMVYCTDIT